MRVFLRRKGFTLLEMLMTMALIAILTSTVMLSVVSVSVTAEAKAIVNNLEMLRTAALAWYKDNSDKFNNADNTPDNAYGNYGATIKIGNKTGQIQQFTGDQLGISKYIHEVGVVINNGAHNPSWEGEYGINAANINSNRKTWFVGYHFYSGGDQDLKDKVFELIKDNPDFRFREEWPEGKQVTDPLKRNYLWLEVFQS